MKSLRDLDRRVVIERLLMYMEISPSGCWEWQKAVTHRGYGYLRLKKRNYTASRLAAWAFSGLEDLHLQVLHKCDNRRCINPQHLFLGTNMDNIRDRDAKGRHADMKGERNARAVLNTENVKDIRRRAAAGEKRRNIADLHGVTVTTIGDIVTRKRWAHVR